MLKGLNNNDRYCARFDEWAMLLNSNHLAFEKFQQDMAGEAERVGWMDERDVVDYCKEIRRELSK